jgi:hypothetical protein
MAYLVDGFTGFRILKINQPEEIVPIYLDETDGIYYRLFYKEGFVYIADIENGLKIFDVRPHKPPSLAGEIKVAEQTRGVFVQDQLAYLVHGEYGFSIVDVTNPEAPTLKGFCETPGWAQRVCVSGSYAYVADFQGGLQIINCSDQEHPAIEKGYRPLDHSITSVCYYKDLVYCLGGHGLFIVDPKDPSNPQLTGNYHLILDGNLSRYNLGLSVIADLAFLATKSDGIDVLDVSDPTSPTLKMNIPLSGIASDMDIHINRGVAYIANGLGGLYILGFSSIPNIYYIKDQLLGRNEPGETINPYWDVNKDFNLDISDITTIINPVTDPVSEP